MSSEKNSGMSKNYLSSWSFKTNLLSLICKNVKISFPKENFNCLITHDNRLLVNPSLFIIRTSIFVAKMENILRNSLMIKLGMSRRLVSKTKNNVNLWTIWFDIHGLLNFAFFGRKNIICIEENVHFMLFLFWGGNDKFWPPSFTGQRLEVTRTFPEITVNKPKRSSNK